MSYQLGFQLSSETSIGFRHFKTLQYRYNVIEEAHTRGAFIRGATRRLIALRMLHKVQKDKNIKVLVLVLGGIGVF